jgi:hypothetical protein
MYHIRDLGFAEGRGDKFEHEGRGMKWIWANFTVHAVVLWNGVGTPDYPSGIPIMHTIHDPKKSVMNPHN